jgi:hypothetical protein
MGLETVEVSLRVWTGTADTVPDDSFLNRLSYDIGKDVEGVDSSDSPWKTARVILASVEMKDLQDAEEPTEAFSQMLNEKLIRSATWLQQQDPVVLQSLRESGHKTDIYIGGWLDDDQLDLNLPAEFIAACARHQLPITLINND